MNDQSKTKQTLIQESASLEYAESIINTVREPLIILDKDLRVITASNSFYKVFKVKPKETEGQLIYDLGNKQWDIPKLREMLESILPQKITFNNYEVEHEFATIGRRVMLLNARQIQRALGKEQIILLAIEDITERRLIEEKLIFASIVEYSKDAIISMSLDGIITTWNKGAEEIFGYIKSEIIGKSISVIVPPNLPEEATEILSKIKLGEGIRNCETVRQRKDGQNIYVSISVSPVYDAEGRIVSASTIARDITERKRLEKLLLESEEQYRLLFETANDGIVLIEKNEGKIAYINKSVEKILGYSTKEVIGNKLQDIGLIIDNGNFQITMKNMNDRGILRYNDIPIKTKSGQQIYTDTYLVDKAKFVQCNIRDITDRKKVDEIIMESEKKYRTLFDDAQDGMALADAETCLLVDCNRALCRMVKRDKLELLGQAQSILHPPEDLIDGVSPTFRQHQINNSGQALEDRLMAKGGHLIPVEIRAAKICINNCNFILDIFRDITERKQAEERTRKALDATVQAIAVTVETKDPYTAGHQVRVSDLACAIAKEMNLPSNMIDEIHMAAAIHDLGKISVPSDILSKPTKLTDIEFNLIKTHSQSGYNILKDIEFPWPIARIILEHHERMNGSGYPNGLTGDHILMESKIVAVADVVEAMASHRPYRPSLGIEAAIKEIEKNRGILYDAAVAEACLRLFREKGYQLTLKEENQFH